MTAPALTIPPTTARDIAPPRKRRVLPGFGLSLGYTITYLSLVVLIPLGGLFLKSAQLTWSDFWGTITNPFVLSALKVSFGASAIAGVINGFFGLLVAWVLVRYPFPGRRIFDALVDFPFALPTAVAGLTFSNTALVTETTPEPASLAIWGLGALGCAIGAYRRRKSARQQSQTK